MIKAPFPINEKLRINDLEYYEILDTERENNFDELGELACFVCNCPTALITFIDKDRQWFKSGINIGAKETLREFSFCSHAILQDEVFVIPNTKKDERFFDNPLVTGNLKINFYAGAPIVSSTGFKLGTVCVLDKTPKDDLNQEQKRALQIIAQQVSQLLELRIINKVVKKHADAQIEIQKRLTAVTILKNRQKDTAIGDTLHENFAQTLAAVRLFLEASERSKELSSYFIQRSRDCLKDMIIDMKNLARSVYSDSSKLI